MQSSSFEKKLAKLLKNCFGPNLHKKGVIMGQAYNYYYFLLTEITKADHQLSETFYFIKLSIWIFFYHEWCQKMSLPFPAKTAVLKFHLRSTKDKVWFISSFNTEVSIRIHDHWSHCPDNNKEGKYPAVCPADDDCPVSGKLQILYPRLIWGSTCLY